VRVRLLPVASQGPGPPRQGAWSPLSFHSFFCAAALVHSTSPDGAVVAILGTVILVSCVRDFSVSGNETLAPWALS